MAKKKKRGNKKKSKQKANFTAIKPKKIEKTYEPEELVKVRYPGAPGSNSKGKRVKIQTVRIDQSLAKKIRKIDLNEYHEYKAIKSILEREQVRIVPEDLTICLQIGSKQIEEEVRKLKAYFKQKKEESLFREVLQDYLLGEIHEIKTWKALKQEIVAIQGLNSNRLFDKGRLLLYKCVLELNDGKINSARIQEAGEMIYEAKGVQGLKEKILWDFIPQSCYPTIQRRWEHIYQAAAA